MSVVNLESKATFGAPRGFFYPKEKPHKRGYAIIEVLHGQVQMSAGLDFNNMRNADDFQFQIRFVGTPLIGNPTTIGAAQQADVHALEQAVWVARSIDTSNDTYEAQEAGEIDYYFAIQTTHAGQVIQGEMHLVYRLMDGGAAAEAVRQAARNRFSVTPEMTAASQLAYSRAELVYAYVWVKTK
jgi:hypothetical protein